MPPRWKLLLAIAIGVVLSVPPVVGFNLWLNDLVERQGQQELDASATRTIALADGRIENTLRTLDALAARGIDTCAASHIEELRQATFATTAIKELSVDAADGRTLCSDLGDVADPRTVVSSEKIAPESDVLLEIVRMARRPGHMVRLVRPGAGTANGLAAVVPSELLFARLTGGGDPRSNFTRINTSSGSSIGEVGDPRALADDTDDHVTGTRKSERYAYNVTVSLPRESVALSRGDIRALGGVVSGLVAILILTLSLLMPKRSRDNPVAELERALRAGEFIPYYQPIVDIRTGQLRGAEVLIRWRKPDGSVISPTSFIPLAESSGLILDMTRALMRRVCQEAGPALELRPHMKIAFNLTARHFADETVVEDVRTIFQKSKIRLSQVVLEVTERQPLENLTETRRVVAALQGLGVRVAIDDVGTGHGGLSYMLKLGVDIIKIDKMFIDALGTDLNSNTIIETLIDLAQNMRMEIIAEGVESFEQVVHLRDLGVRSAQGFVFAPPLPASAFLQLVDAIDPSKSEADRMPSDKFAEAKPQVFIHAA